MIIFKIQFKSLSVVYELKFDTKQFRSLLNAIFWRIDFTKKTTKPVNLYGLLQARDVFLSNHNSYSLFRTKMFATRDIRDEPAWRVRLSMTRYAFAGLEII